jgi:hypothetical protein
MLPEAAVIEATPTAKPVARPFEPGALLIVAVTVSEDIQVTEPVRICVVLSV